MKCETVSQANLQFPDQVSAQDPRLLPLRDTVQTWIEQKRIPSMAVAVWQNGAILWLEAFGMADLEKQIPATPQTVYPLGSMSKSIAATALMTLVEKGQIQLDQSVNPLIAPAQLRSSNWEVDSVKVWHILNSAAGIPHGWTEFNNQQHYPRSAKEKEQWLTNFGVVSLPPGKFHHYSNYSFGVADLLMERVSGQQLEKFLREALFNPLGMEHSHSTFLPQSAAPYAMTYLSDFSPFGRLTSMPYGGLGYYSSAADLIRYALLHLKRWPGEDVLSHKIIELMHHPAQSSSRLFGLGWHDAGHALISNGSVTGANSHLSLVTEHDLAVICLTNISAFTGYADQLGDMIVAALVPDLIRQLTYEKYVEEFETPYVFNTQLAGTWSGLVYGREEDLPISMDFRTDGSVWIQIDPGSSQQLQQVIFNKHGLLNGRFDGQLPMPYGGVSEAANHELILYLYQGELVGHIAAAYSNQQGSFRFGVETSLKKY